jgi:hypothetical protein
MFALDIAIGAWQSDHAIVLRTKPIIAISGVVSIDRRSIRLTEKDCVDQNKHKTTW